MFFTLMNLDITSPPQNSLWFLTFLVGHQTIIYLKALHTMRKQSLIYFVSMWGKARWWVLKNWTLIYLKVRHFVLFSVCWTIALQTQLTSFVSGYSFDTYHFKTEKWYVDFNLLTASTINIWYTWQIVFFSNYYKNKPNRLKIPTEKLIIVY